MGRLELQGLCPPFPTCLWRFFKSVCQLNKYATLNERPDSVMMVFEIKMSKIFTTVRAALSE